MDFLELPAAEKMDVNHLCMPEHLSAQLSTAIGAGVPGQSVMASLPIFEQQKLLELWLHYLKRNREDSRCVHELGTLEAFWTRRIESLESEIANLRGVIPTTVPAASPHAQHAVRYADLAFTEQDALCKKGAAMLRAAERAKCQTRLQEVSHFLDPIRMANPSAPQDPLQQVPSESVSSSSEEDDDDSNLAQIPIPFAPGSILEGEGEGEGEG